ncbi:MAG: anion permease [Desulfovibrionaceae bacterium]|nr:anion permease [Desulfovibrionaceae bacterium]
MLTALGVWATAGCAQQTRVAAGAVVFLVCCWGFRLLKEGTAALVFFLVLVVGRVLEPERIFSGFTTPAFWLVFSGLIIGKAISVSGLSHRLARRFRSPGSTSYSALLARIIVVCMVFALFVPSAMGRVVILLPLLADISADCGFRPGDRGHVGVLVAGIMGTFLPAFGLLPSNLSNLILAGSAKALYNIEYGYMQYFLLHYPVLGVGKGVLLWWMVKTMFRDEVRGTAERAPSEKLTTREMYTMVLLALALGFWVLDSLHGISPGWIGLAAAIVFLMPFPGWFGKDALLDGVKIDTLLFMACAIGVGNVIRHTGLGDFATDTLLRHMPLSPDGGIGNLATVLGLYMSSGLMMSMPGIPSMFVPLAGHIAQAAHLPVETLLALMVPAFSTVLLPYQAPPVIVGSAAAGITYRNMLAACLGLAALTIFVLFPLDLLWWKLIGVPMSVG